MYKLSEVSIPLHELIDYTEEEAISRLKSAGIENIRVFDENRKEQTLAYSSERVNLYLKDGRVTIVDIG